MKERIKTIIIAGVTSIITIMVFMVTLTNVVKPIEYKEEVKTEVEKIATEPMQQKVEKNEVVLGGTEENWNGTNITSAVVGIAVSNDTPGISLNQSLGNNYSVGSGFIVDSNGLIVTNHHVTGGRTSDVYVTLNGGDTITGGTIWADEKMDLAVVKINVSGLPVSKLGDSSNLKVGESAYAVGNPLGFEFQRTVTRGIVSAVNRSIKVDNNYMEDLIQTDASINPGNSGGPLINGNGEIIGINTVKVASAEGIGFAIPINIIKPIVEKIKSTGGFEEVDLGMTAYDKGMISNFSNKIRLNSGLYVNSVKPGGICANAGIQKGHIISKIDGQEIATMCDFKCKLFAKNYGSSAVLTVVSNGESREVEIGL